METEKFQELVLHKLDTLTTGQEKLEGRMDRLEHTVDIIKGETAGLMEFRTQTAEALKKLKDVVETQSVMSDILGEHEIQIRKIQKRLA